MNGSLKRIALVTGANKGIGLEIARQIAQSGAFVLIGARDAQRGKAAIEDLSAELQGSSITVDSVCPGLTKTDMTGQSGDRLPAEAAVTPAKLALMAQTENSGRFVDAEGKLPW